MSGPTRKIIGVIGLGIIGRAVSTNLRQKGFQVFVWNRTPRPVPNFVDSPFTGSKVAAENGELVYYVGGTDAALRDARPILEASGKQIIKIGEIGQATVIKIATNMVTAASVQAASEALAVVRALGLPFDRFVEAMQGNASHSTTLAMKVPKMIEHNFGPHFSVKHMLKDMEIANQL